MAAKFGDENVEAPAIEEGVVAPEFGKYFAAAENFVALLIEAAEEFGLPVGQCNFPVVDGQFLLGGVENIAADFQRPVSACAGSTHAQERIDARDELIETEWFFEIIVSSQLKTPYHVGRLGTCRQEYDRRMRVVAADVLGHCKTVHIGHHDVGHNDIGLVLPELFEALDPIRGIEHIETPVNQAIFHNHAQRGFVLDK